MKRLLPFLWCVLLAQLSGGCASLQDKTAPHTGCAPSEITIVEDHVGWDARNWVAECRGRRYQCANVSTGSRSSQIDCALDPSVVRPVERARESAEDGSQVWVLRAQLQNAGRTFQLTSAPTRDATRVLLTISAPQARLPFGCSVGLMVDGALHPLEIGLSRSHEGVRYYEIDLSTDLLRRAGTAERVVARLCEDEWRLAPEEQQTMRELVTRIDEELAWSGTATAGGERPR